MSDASNPSIFDLESGPAPELASELAPEAYDLAPGRETALVAAGLVTDRGPDGTADPDPALHFATDLDADAAVEAGAEDGVRSPRFAAEATQGDQRRLRLVPEKRRNGRRAPEEEPAPLRRILEAILFATDRPVTIEQLLPAVPEVSTESLQAELESMASDYEASGHGVRLRQTAGGYQFQTAPELHEYVHRFLVGKKRSRLSRAAMETLSIIAYRQPITRGEVEEIRGVDCGQVFHTLLERDMVTVRGRSQALGRPLLYGTTMEFLRYFGIDSLADLPSLEELHSLLGQDPLADPEIRSALESRGLLEDGSVGEVVQIFENDANDGAVIAEQAEEAEADEYPGIQDTSTHPPALPDEPCA